MRTTTRLVVLGLLGLAGCGDDGESSPSTTTMTTGDTDPATTSGLGTMGTAQTMGTVGTAGTVGTDPGTAGSSTGGAVDGVTYSAVSIPGDPNQIQVRRKDDNNDRCTWIILTDQSVGILAIATPAGWTPQVGLTNDNPDSCDEPDPLVGGSIEASAGTGDIAEAEAGTSAVPCALDVEVELSFPGLDLTEVFSASGVTVQGC